MTEAEVLRRAWASLRRGEGAEARELLAKAETTSASGELQEAMATAAYLELDFDSSIRHWEQAFGRYRETGDDTAALKAARVIASLYGTYRGDWAVASGWLARGRSMRGEPGSIIVGWLDLTAGMFEGRRAQRNQLLSQALAVGRAHAESTLTAAALAYLGASLVHADEGEAGMGLLDESLAVVVGDGVDDVVVIEEVFCQLFSACERAHDVGRARQWLRAGEAVSGRRNLPMVSAYCHTHFGGVMTAAGRWSEADSSLSEAVRLWVLEQRTLKTGALCRLAELRVRQGRYDEAATLLRGLPVDAESAGPLASLHLARGEVARARDVLERELSRADPVSTERCPLLSLLVETCLAEDDPARAQEAAEALVEVAGRHGGDYVSSLAALAQGQVATFSGAEAGGWLADAVDGFARAELPWETARARLLLAEACLTTNPSAAAEEAELALETFERLEARHQAQSARALLAQCRLAGGRSTHPTLSARETEVLSVLGEGLSNPEIAARLFISRKTVEHHVGSILSKLGLRNRAEAAAYAARLPH